jgi:hypothetical protein
MRRRKFKHSKKTLLIAAEKAIKKLNGEIVHVDHDKGIMDADIPGNLLTYGHEVRITVKPTPDKMNSVSVTSKSMGIQIIDWGTNANTEEDIIKKINSLIS